MIKVNKTYKLHDFLSAPFANNRVERIDYFNHDVVLAVRDSYGCAQLMRSGEITHIYCGMDTMKKHTLNNGAAFNQKLRRVRAKTHPIGADGFQMFALDKDTIFMQLNRSQTDPEVCINLRYMLSLDLLNNGLANLSVYTKGGKIRFLLPTVYTLQELRQNRDDAGLDYENYHVMGFGERIPQLPFVGHNDWDYDYSGGLLNSLT